MVAEDTVIRHNTLGASPGVQARENLSPGAA
jgi:hypothetical protein